MEFYDFPFSWKFQKIPTDDSSMIFQSSTTNQYHNCKKKRLGHQSHTSMVGEIIYGQPPDWPDAKWNTTIQKKQPKISQVPKYLVKLHHKLSGGKNSTHLRDQNLQNCMGVEQVAMGRVLQ